MSTLKADAITAVTSNTDVVITGAGSGVPDIEASFKVGGTAGVPMSSIRTTSGTASASTFLRGDGQWQAPGGGAFNVIASGTLSAASEVEFTDLSSNVRFIFFGDPNTNTQDMRLQVSSDNGSSWISTSSYDYSSHYIRATTNTLSGIAYSNQANFATGQNGGLSGNLVLDISQMQSTTFKTEFFSQTGQSDYYAFAYGVANPTAVAHNAARFFPLSGTITGKYALVNLG